MTRSPNVIQAELAALRRELREALMASAPPKPTKDQLDQMVGPSEIARRTGLTRAAISNWIARGGFPSALIERTVDGKGSLYWWPDVQMWLIETERA